MLRILPQPASLGSSFALACALLLTAQSASAIDRVVRIFDQSHGLPTDAIAGIAQDVSGFIWIATPGGLVRFDGAQMRRWQGADRGLNLVRAGPRGDVMVVDVFDAAFRVLDTGLIPVDGPGGALQGVLDMCFDATGALWVVRELDVLRRAPDGEWKAFPKTRFASEALRLVRADGDHALVLTVAGVWSVTGSGDVQRVATTAFPFDVVRRADGVLAVLAGSTVYLQRNGALVEVLELPGRGIALTTRGESVWAGYDRFLARITPDEAPVVISPSDDLPSGGPMLVDHEGSLWVASFRGLLQFPEPDTIAWTEKDGLPTSHARFVGRNVDGVWVTIGDRGQPEIGLRAFNGSASPVHVVLTLLEPGQAKSGPSDNPNDPGSKARVARQEEFLLQPGQAAEVTLPCNEFPSGQVVGAVGEVKGDLSGVSAALQVTETNTLDHKVFAYVPMQMGVGILPPQ